MLARTDEDNIILDDDQSPFRYMMSLADAAEIWRLDPSTIRKAIKDGRLRVGRDCAKFGKQWVVTKDGMHELTGTWFPWSTYRCDRVKAKKKED